MDRITPEQRKERVAMLAPMTLKKLVVGRGHDCGGLIADVYLKNKKIAEYHDDGWGGEPEIYYMKDGDQAKLETFITEIKLEEHMLASDWSSFKDSGLGVRTCIEAAVEYIASEMMELKEIKKLQTKALVLRKDGNLYTKKFKVSIAQIKKSPRLEQQLKDIMKKEIAEGCEILNTNTPEI